MSDEEWGDWIEHDGKGCPCVGMWVESVDSNGVTLEHIAGGLRISALTGALLPADAPVSACAWTWKTRPAVRIIRYRIRRPRALRELIEMVENLPPVKPKVDA